MVLPPHTTPIDSPIADPTDGVMTDRLDLTGVVAATEAKPGIKRVLVADHIRVVVFDFLQGQGLPEHTAAFPIMVQSLRGTIRFTAGGKTTELTPGDIAHLTTRLPHGVEALTDATLMLTMLDPDARGTAEQ